VVALQQFIIAQNLLPAGSAIGRLGKKTEQAVKAWQSAHGIVSAGSAATTGYGAVGEKTRRAMSCSSVTPPARTAGSIGTSTSGSAPAAVSSTASASSIALGGLSQLAQLLKQTQANINDFIGYRVDGATFQEQKIDLQTIVLVRSVYKTQ